MLWRWRTAETANVYSMRSKNEQLLHKTCNAKRGIAKQASAPDHVQEHARGVSPGENDKLEQARPTYRI